MVPAASLASFFLLGSLSSPSVNIGHWRSVPSRLVRQRNHWRTGRDGFDGGGRLRSFLGSGDSGTPTNLPMSENSTTSRVCFGVFCENLAHDLELKQKENYGFELFEHCGCRATRGGTGGGGKE